jgi:hypothetical protein
MSIPANLKHVVAEQARRKRQLTQLQKAADVRKREQQLQTSLKLIDSVQRRAAGGVVLQPAILKRVASSGLGSLLLERLGAGKEGK